MIPSILFQFLRLAGLVVLLSGCASSPTRPSDAPLPKSFSYRCDILREHSTYGRSRMIECFAKRGTQWRLEVTEPGQATKVMIHSGGQYGGSDMSEAEAARMKQGLVALQALYRTQQYAEYRGRADIDGLPLDHYVHGANSDVRTEMFIDPQSKRFRRVRLAQPKLFILMDYRPLLPADALGNAFFNPKDPAPRLMSH